MVTLYHSKIDQCNHLSHRTRSLSPFILQKPIMVTLYHTETDNGHPLSHRNPTFILNVYQIETQHSWSPFITQKHNIPGHPLSHRKIHSLTPFITQKHNIPGHPLSHINPTFIVTIYHIETQHSWSPFITLKSIIVTLYHTEIDNGHPLSHINR